MVEDGYDLLARDAFEVVQELVDGRAVFESFEKRGDGEPGVLEDPRSANFVRASFDGVATVPVAHGGAFSLHGFYVLGEFSIDTAGMALDDDVEVECAVGRGHRLYSDRRVVSHRVCGGVRRLAPSGRRVVVAGSGRNVVTNVVNRGGVGRSRRTGDVVPARRRRVSPVMTGCAGWDLPWYPTAARAVVAPWFQPAVPVTLAKV